ncbi:hypothetical protein L7F22_049218 [Adiantum nelumboides]|nr:hypothetical protein [Adiantum nelumboides]
MSYASGRKQYVCSIQKPEELITVLEKISFADTMVDLENIVESKIQHGEDVVKIHSIDMYEMIAKFQSSLEDAVEAHMATKYKPVVAKKVKCIAAPLPKESDKIMEKISKDHSLRNLTKIGHKFTKETLDELKIGEGYLTDAKIKCFQEMVAKHGKAFAFQPSGEFYNATLALELETDSCS